MDGPPLCWGHFSCISQEFGSHYPSPRLFFSALVERRTSQYESEQTCRRQEAAGAIQKCKRWSWTVYGIYDAYDAEHVFHSCFCRGYHLDEGKCDHAGCVYANPQLQRKSSPSTQRTSSRSKISETALSRLQMIAISV